MRIWLEFSAQGLKVKKIIVATLGISLASIEIQWITNVLDDFTTSRFHETIIWLWGTFRIKLVAEQVYFKIKRDTDSDVKYKFLETEMLSPEIYEI